MAVAIYATGHTWFTNDGTVEEVRAMIERGEKVRCFWFQSHGTRCVEEFWFPYEKVDMIRSESDD